MKKMIMRQLGRAIAIAAMGVVLTACGAKEEPSFDGRLLVGRWENDAKAGDFYRFDSNSDANGCNGAAWYAPDVPDESYAQKFKWTLNGSSLVLQHWMEITQSFDNLPKYYTLVELSAARLKFKDNVSGAQKTFSKK